MSEAGHIKSFWDDKKNFAGKDMLKEKARVYYSEDFIDNYTLWRGNVDNLNTLMWEKLNADNFPADYWKDMPYDWFCQRMNSMIEEWIELNEDIEPTDIPLILEKLMTDYIAKALEFAYANMYTSEALLRSIKTPKAY